MTSSTVTSERDAKLQIRDHIQNRGGPPNKWYSGITNDPSHRLFSDHNVSKKNGKWIWRKLATSASARRVEKYLINELGTQGGGGGGGTDSVYVYSYKITSSTCEDC